MSDQDNSKPVEITGGYLIFEISGRRYMLAMENVEEVLPIPSLSCQPGSPSVLAGFMNLGGDAIPVLHLSRLLEMPDPPLDINAHVIIASHQHELYGLIVSRVIQLILWPGSCSVSLPGCALTRHAIKLGEEIIPVVNVEALVLEQEHRRIAELREVQQRRLHQLEEAQT